MYINFWQRNLAQEETVQIWCPKMCAIMTETIVIEEIIFVQSLGKSWKVAIMEQ